MVVVGVLVVFAFVRRSLKLGAVNFRAFFSHQFLPALLFARGIALTDRRVRTVAALFARESRCGKERRRRIGDDDWFNTGMLLFRI